MKLQHARLIHSVLYRSIDRFKGREGSAKLVVSAVIFGYVDFQRSVQLILIFEWSRNKQLFEELISKWPVGINTESKDNLGMICLKKLGM